MFNGLLTKDFIVCLLKASFFLGCSFCDCLFFSYSKNVIFDWNSSEELHGAETLKWTHRFQTPHHVCATVFHRQHLWTHPPDLNSLYILIYWDCVRNAGSQTRCCTTLYVARCFIVFLCAVCNKDKVSATLWRLNELLKCEAGVWCC